MDSYWKLHDEVFVCGKIVQVTECAEKGILYTVKFVKSPSLLNNVVVLKGEDITEKVGACEG